MRQSTPHIERTPEPEPTPLRSPAARTRGHPILARPPPTAPARALGPPVRPPPSITQLDTELHRLARGAGRLRLRIGQALHRLGNGIHELGFSTLGDYSLERCNRGGRWAAESRTLARHLESLPHLTHALESGAIGWSMADLLARHATPQTEAALLQVARGQTVHSMRIALAAQSSPPAQSSPGSHPTSQQTNADTNAGANTNAKHLNHIEDTNEDLTRTLSLTLPIEEAWALEATRTMVQHMDGKPTNAHFLESLLAEATVPLFDLPPLAAQQQEAQPGREQHHPPQQPVHPSAPHVADQMRAEAEAWRAHMRQQQLQQATAEQQSRPQVPTNFASTPTAGTAPSPADLPSDLHALDARIRQYSAELASRDIFFGRLAQRFLSLRGWQALGFTTEAHYARERLGMSRASLRSKVTLARRTHALPQTVDALQQGRIGFEAAHLISRIATPTTERAWLTRATRRTFKHLREEVQTVEAITRYLAPTNGSPPTPSQIKQTQEVERAILSGEFFRKLTQPSTEQSPVQISGSPEHNERNSTERPTNVCESQQQFAEGSTVQISGAPGNAPPTVPASATSAAKVTLRFRVPGDVLLLYRQLERLHQQKRPGESFIKYLCTEFWQTWAPTLGTSDKWEHIYRRDRYRCTSPVCHQRNVTLHHVKYQAHGGTDDPTNLTSPCAFCHLEGEHGGRLKILPPGNNPTWLLGRTPIIRVQARERTLLS